MRNRDIQTLADNIRAIQDIKDDLESAVSKFQNDITQIETDLNRQFALKHIITKIKSILDDVDADVLFDFIDNIDSECSDLYYKLQKADKSNEISAFRKVINPAFYNPQNF